METDALREELQTLEFVPLPDLMVRLARLTDDHRGRLLAAINDDPALQHRLGLVHRVLGLFPGHASKDLARDVAFLLARCPDPEHERLLLGLLTDTGDGFQKQVYADFLEERGDPLAPALRAEAAAAVCGVLDAQRHLGVAYTPEHLATLGQMPFSPEAIEECRDTHVFVAGARLSLNDIRGRASDQFSDSHWYREAAFATDVVVRPRWHLLREQAMPGSRQKTWSRQIALLKPEEEVPFVCEMTDAVILHRLAHGEQLLPNADIRCQDADSDCSRIGVGGSDADGFDVFSYLDDGRYGDLGLASSVTPRQS